MDSAYTDLTDSFNKLISMYSNIDSYKTECVNKLSQCDRALSDLDHNLEFSKLNASQLIQLVIKRQNILKDRRVYKNELNIIDSIISADKNPNETSKRLTNVNEAIKKSISAQNNRKYTQRTDIELITSDKDNITKPIDKPDNIDTPKNNKPITSWTDYKGKVHKISNKKNSLERKLEMLGS